MKMINYIIIFMLAITCSQTQIVTRGKCPMKKVMNNFNMTTVSTRLLLKILLKIY